MTQHKPLAAPVAATQEPAFLPLAVSSARTAERSLTDQRARANAARVRERAEAADQAAAECWTALVAGCQSSAGRTLTTRLRELTEAISAYVGLGCWFRASSPHRQRVVGAQNTIAEAVDDGDGAEFAEAFVGYDQAIATAVVSMLHRMDDSTGSSTP